MIAGVNESKTLTKHLSCECKYRFHGMINVDVNVKKFMYVKESMFGILVNVFLKMENI